MENKTCENLCTISRDDIATALTELKKSAEYMKSQRLDNTYSECVAMICDTFSKCTGIEPVMPKSNSRPTIESIHDDKLCFHYYMELCKYFDMPILVRNIISSILTSSLENARSIAAHIILQEYCNSTEASLTLERKNRALLVSASDDGTPTISMQKRPRSRTKQLIYICNNIFMPDLILLGACICDFYGEKVLDYSKCIKPCI